MAKKKFAFESEEVSIAFTLNYGLGDCLIAKKVFDALIELAPRCVIDIFFEQERHFVYAHAFYGDSKNLNLILSRPELYKNVVKQYDLALWVVGNHFINLEHVNSERLHAMAPELLQSVIRIHEYNQQNIYNQPVSLRDMIRARILKKSCFYFLSCDGALPIRDDRISVALAPEYKPKFDALKLDNYITIYADIGKDRDRPKNKTWPARYLYEFVARVRKRYPQVEIVQAGGANDVEIENADRRLLNGDLELTKYVLANSLLLIGCEGGLVHLATALGTKCVVLFGASGVDYFGYDRNINIVSDVCFPCMYTAAEWTDCLRGDREPPCMLSITPQHVCEVTCNYLKHCGLEK